MKRILVIGELLWDLLPDGRKLGGAPANFAFRLGSYGYDTRLVSSVGNDSYGKEAIGILASHGLNVGFIQVSHDFPTGTVDVTFDSQKNPDYVINTGVAYDHIRIDKEVIDFTRETDCIAYGTLTQRSEKSRIAVESLIKMAGKAEKFLDINLRKNCFTPEIVHSSLSHADILKMNRDEAFELNRMFDLGADGLPAIGTTLLNKYNLKICLITLEDKGALLAYEQKQVIYNPGFKVRMEDPLGAGDAFSAAFIHSFFRGESMYQAVEQANKVGAMVVSQKGAMQPITPGDLRLFSTNHHERIYDKNFIHYLTTK